MREERIPESVKDFTAVLNAKPGLVEMGPLVSGAISRTRKARARVEGHKKLIVVGQNVRRVEGDLGDLPAQPICRQFQMKDDRLTWFQSDGPGRIRFARNSRNAQRTFLRFSTGCGQFDPQQRMGYVARFDDPGSNDPPIRNCSDAHVDNAHLHSWCRGGGEGPQSIRVPRGLVVVRQKHQLARATRTGQQRFRQSQCPGQIGRLLG